MPANNNLQVTGTNFDTIKANLKSFLSNQSALIDYDFEDSTMGILIDLLTYNTYYNAVYLNQVANEMYLDSALLRNNVVSRAKMLGYTPTSYKGAIAHVNIVFSPGGSPEYITIPKNTTFTTTMDNLDYTFVTPGVTLANSGSSYTANVQIVEGTPLTHRYTVSSVSPVRYLLPNRGSDTSSLSVRVIASSSNSSSNVYTQATDLTAVSGNTANYFVQEYEDGKYELTFGDGYIGKRLVDGNIVEIQYRVCNGTIVNGAKSFTGPGTIGGETYSLTTSSVAALGANAEGIASIKFNAPKNYATQNRAVVAEDYKRIIISNHSDIKTLRAWGGEENDPPVYGRVYLAAKPYSGTLISSARKEELIRFLEERNLLSIDPIFVDPAYLYIKPVVKGSFDPDITLDNGSTVATNITTAIQNYEIDNLGDFTDRYYNSDFILKMATAHKSIISIDVTLYLQKRFRPTTAAIGIGTTYKIRYNNSIYNPYSGYKGAVSSSSFTYKGIANNYIEDDGAGVISFYYNDPSAGKVISNATAGTVDYALGEIILDNILFNAYDGTDIKINVEPSSRDVHTVRNLIPLFADASITLFNNRTNLLDTSISSITTTGTTTVIVETGTDIMVI
jgi:hypothetical protein